MIEQNNPYYNNKLSDNTSLYGGVGYAVSSLSELKSYIQAYQTLHIAKCNILKDMILHYNQISLFRMIDINNQYLLKCVVSDYLALSQSIPNSWLHFLHILIMIEIWTKLQKNCSSMSTVLSIVYSRYIISFKSSLTRRTTGCKFNWLQSFTDIYSITSNKAILNFSSAVTLWSPFFQSGSSRQHWLHNPCPRIR